MQGVDHEQAILYKMQDILKRLRPLVKEIIDRDPGYHSPVDEADQLKTSIASSLKQLEANLSKLDFPSNNSS